MKSSIARATAIIMETLATIAQWARGPSKALIIRILQVHKYCCFWGFISAKLNAEHDASLVFSKRQQNIEKNEPKGKVSIESVLERTYRQKSRLCSQVFF